MTIYTCCGNCNRDFDTPRALAIHRTACLIFKRHEATALEKRKVISRTTLRRSNNAPGKSQGKARQSSLHIARFSHSMAPEMSGDVQDTEFMDFSSQLPLNDMPPQPYPHAEAYTPTGRLKRSYRLPKRYIDVPPVGPAPVITVAEPLPPATSVAEPLPPATSVTEPSPPSFISQVQNTLRTALNRFGLLREYSRTPSHDPDCFVPLGDLSNQQVPTTAEGPPVQDTHTSKPPQPFANMSIYRLMEWATTGSHQKSQGEVNRLVKEVIGAPDFRAEDLTRFSAQREYTRFDQSEMKGEKNPLTQDGWHESSIHISVPTGIADSQAKGDLFTVPGFHYRSLVGVMKAALQDVTARRFHFSPFKRFVKGSSGAEERCFDEVYTSDAFLEADANLQQRPNEPGCELEKVVLGLMFWSDATHLANFGTAKVWPIYLYFANLSKYFRGKPGSGAAHHVAYIPSLPDFINDFITVASQKAEILTHCRRELMQKVWDKLLDSEFMLAYEHGYVMMCLDGISRRFYPRIFTYSADYPEKVLIATIRNNGDCPCPRCLVTKPNIDKIGYLRDAQSRISNARTYARNLVLRARTFIYELGYGVSSAAVERLLKDHSLVPTLNTFGEKLGPFGFDPFVMLVVDLLHEFELGIWRTIFTHLIRLLHAAAPAGRLVTELDRRFRQIPTFGRSTIRRFCTNVSGMKKLAARNYEDLLQCAIPAFEGLLPEPHNKIVMTLLYRLCEWHALAKLRMHTDSTLSLMDAVTITLGRELRTFRDVTCAAFATTELPKEAAARGRRRRKAQANAGSASHNPPPNPAAPNAAPGGIAAPIAVPPSSTSSGSLPSPHTIAAVPSPPIKKKKKTLKISSYKFHALADYVRTIRMFGTTDSYSTQTGELEHRRVKRLYGQTNKNQAIRQMTRHERRETRLLRARRAELAAKVKTNHSHHVGFSENDPLPYADAEMHHHISDNRRHYQDAFSFVNGSPNDAATRDFVPKLKDHLLSRLLNQETDSDELHFSDEDRNTVRIVNNRIYSAKVLRINFTTYDVRRDQDSMNPRTHCDVMVISRETGANAHPFWYARVLGVFHAQVFHVGPFAKNRSVQHMEFLWVRWFGTVPGYRYGPRFARLPKIGFIPDTDESAFGFLDPSLVIRGCHLIPAFVDGRTSDLLTIPTSLGRSPGETDDWVAFYVMIFVDRDMFVRYLGGGVGHSSNASPEPNADKDAAMEEDEGGWDDVASGDSGIEVGSENNVEIHAEGQGTDSSDSESDDSAMGERDGNDDDEDDDEDEEELGPDDGEGGKDDDDGYASF